TAAAPGTAAQPDKLRFRGKVVLPDVFNATADLTKNELTNTDGYLEINGNGEVKWFGKLSVEDIVIVPDLWEVKEASLELREVAGVGLSVQGDAKVVIPPGIEIVCGLGFVNEQFNYIRLGVGDLDIPIGATGAFLQEINGLVNNIADEDATKIAFGGGVGLTAGPELNLSLPSWAGGDLEGSLAEFGLEGSINHTELAGSGTLKMVGGLVEGQAVAALNWEKGTLSSGCTLTALDGLITIDGKFNADSNMNVNVIGQGKVTIPSIVPLWGGRQISGATSQLVFTNDDNYGNDFVAGWGSLSMSILGKVRTIGLGLKVNFDGSYSILGSKESTRTQLVQAEPAAAMMVKSCEVVTADDSVIGPLVNDLAETSVETSDTVTRYQVADGSEWLMINASWESGSIDSMYLLAPDGTRYDDFINSDKVTIVNDLSGGNNSVIFVDSPESGTWQLVVESGTSLSGLAFDGYHDSVMPEIDIEQISYNELAGNVSVSYQADGSLAGRQVAFYCDTNSADADGVLLGYDTDGDGVFSGDVSGFASGEYYVYAMVYDDVNMPTVSYSEQTVTITEQAELVSVNFGTGSAGKVTYTDADGTVVTVTVKGDSGVLKFAGDNIMVSSAKNAATVSGTNLVLSSVEMAGAGPAALTFAAKGGTDNSATIGNISGNEFKSLTGKGIVLAGNVDLAGPLGAMKWGQIDDMVNISASAPLKGLSIAAANVGDQVNIAIDGILKSVAVTSYSSGSITADSIGKVTVKQDDFAASVTAVTGDIQALTVTGAITGNISAANAIKAVTTKGNLSATMRAGTVIGKVTALDMVDSFLSSGGDVTSVTLKGKMLDSNVMAGYDLGSDMVFGNDDLPGSGNIGSVSVKGEFANSSLMAGVVPDTELASGSDLYLPWVGTSGKISKLKFGSINYQSANEFGLYAADTIASFKIGKTVAQSQGDFVIMTY
ncbi:MAG: hypothetical protein JXM68_07540, partial [Sedimentisphaerales bacterium]|nr:hypothetical protein [Sedimentisphaerales bacterium]